MLALTATATLQVILDISKGFAIEEGCVVRTGFHRSNLSLHAAACGYACWLGSSRALPVWQRPLPFSAASETQISPETRNEGMTPGAWPLARGGFIVGTELGTSAASRRFQDETGGQ